MIKKVGDVLDLRENTEKGYLPIIRIVAIDESFESFGLVSQSAESPDDERNLQATALLLCQG